MITQDGVVIQVQVFASGIWGISLEGCVVGAGSAWHWCSIATAWVFGGFAIIAGCGAGQSCHWWVIRNFADAGFMDGGMHVQGWQVMELERGVDDCSLGDLLLMSCSHCWGGLGGQA